MLDKVKNTGEPLPYLRNANVRWGSFNISDMLSMPFEEDEIQRYSIKKGDIVVCEGGEPGRCAIWESETTVMFQKALHRLRCFSGISQKYLTYILHLYSSKNILDEYFTGSTIKHLTGNALDSVVYPLPPLAEQQRIVKEVERWFALIDKIEQNKDDLSAAVNQAKSKILDLAIHGKLVPQDPNDEPATELLRRINPSAQPCDKGPYPNGWCQTTLGVIGTWQSGATPSRYQKEYYGGNIPWLKTGDLNDGYITEIPEYITEKALAETSVKLNPKDSVLIAMYGATIGKIGILTFPATTNQACCACTNYITNKMYLFYFLLANRNEFIALGGGGAQPNISKEKIVNTIIPLPPLAEQHRIVAKIEELFTLLDSIQSSLEA